jgi:hypothetical protein
MLDAGQLGLSPIFGQIDPIWMRFMHRIRPPSLLLELWRRLGHAAGSSAGCLEAINEQAAYCEN